VPCDNLLTKELCRHAAKEIWFGEIWFGDCGQEVDAAGWAFRGLLV
jgi:hypothetical protein